MHVQLCGSHPQTNSKLTNTVLKLLQILQITGRL